MEELSVPLLNKQAQSQQRTLTKPRHSLRYKHRRRSEAIRRSARRRSIDSDEPTATTTLHRAASGISTDTGFYSETTERVSNIEEEALLTVEEEEVPVSALTKIKTGCIISLTIVAVGAYCTSFANVLLVSESVSAVNLAVLGAAMGLCVLITPVVWLNEWKLIRYPGELIERITWVCVGFYYFMISSYYNNTKTKG